MNGKDERHEEGKDEGNQDLLVLEKLLVWDDAEFHDFSFENAEEIMKDEETQEKLISLQETIEEKEKNSTEIDDADLDVDDEKERHFAEKIDQEQNVILLSGKNVKLEISHAMLKSWEDSLLQSAPSALEENHP